MIFQGETTHCRHRPRRHAFRYAMFWLAIDLDELERLDREVGGFGHNRWAIASLMDADYGGSASGGIRERVVARLAAAGVTDASALITLITVPRILGYVFNPVSFYVCRDASGGVRALVAEVRNTFGELHQYISQPEAESPQDCHRFRLPKQFFVSPFLGVDGEYEVELCERGNRFDLQIQLRAGDSLVFSAGMSGAGVELTSGALMKTLARFPLFAAMIMPRITWQALRLYIRRRLPLYEKPTPTHRMTIAPIRPGRWHRLRAAIVRQGRQACPAQCSEPITPEKSPL